MLTGTFAHLIPVGSGQALFVSLIAVVWVALVLTYHRGWATTPDRAKGRLISFALGLGLVMAAVSPPIEHYADDLLSVHMIQHMILLVIGAPLIASSRPVETLMRGLATKARKRLGKIRRATRMTPSTTTRLARPLIVWLAYALAIWFWHGAAPYEAALANPWLHVLEHVVFLAVALAFWSMVLVAGRSGGSIGLRILAVFTTLFHSVLLGALLTFSDTVWYPSYVEPTASFGIDPLADQRLAGLLMWIPGGLVYTGAALWLLTGWLRGQVRSDGGDLRSFSTAVDSGLTSSPRERV